MAEYFPNPSEVACARTWHGPYTVLGNPHVNDKTRTSFQSQISSIFKVPNKKDMYIAIADRWIVGELPTTYENIEKIFLSMFNPDAEKLPMGQVGEQEPTNTSIADYVWLPLRFEGDRPYIDWKDEWKLEDYE